MRRPKTYDEASLAAVAVKYYREQKSQSEIAKELGTTRQVVSAMLREAEILKIVEIKITHSGLSAQIAELSRSLRDHYNVQFVIEADDLIERAADSISYLYSKVKGLAIGGGTFLSIVIDRLNHKGMIEYDMDPISILPATGIEPRAIASAPYVANKLAIALSRNGVLIDLLFPSNLSEEERAVISRGTSARKYFEAATELDTVLVDIGRERDGTATIGRYRLNALGSPFPDNLQPFGIGIGIFQKLAEAGRGKSIYDRGMSPNHVIAIAPAIPIDPTVMAIGENIDIELVETVARSGLCSLIITTIPVASGLRSRIPSSKAQ